MEKNTKACKQLLCPSILELFINDRTARRLSAAFKLSTDHGMPRTLSPAWRRIQKQPEDGAEHCPVCHFHRPTVGSGWEIQMDLHLMTSSQQRRDSVHIYTATCFESTHSPVPRKVCQKQTEKRNHSSIVLPSTIYRRQVCAYTLKCTCVVLLGHCFTCYKTIICSDHSCTHAGCTDNLLRIVVAEAQDIVRTSVGFELDFWNSCKQAHRESMQSV